MYGFLMKHSRSRCQGKTEQGIKDGVVVRSCQEYLAGFLDRDDVKPGYEWGPVALGRAILCDCAERLLIRRFNVADHGVEQTRPKPNNGMERCQVRQLSDYGAEDGST